MVESFGVVKAIGKRKAVVVPEMGTKGNGEGDGSNADVDIITVDGFGTRSRRLQGSKAAKGELLVH